MIEVTIIIGGVQKTVLVPEGISTDQVVTVINEWVGPRPKK